MVNLKLIRSILLVLVCTGWSGKAACQADGARMHLPAPTGLHVVQLRWMALLDANSSFDPSLVTPRSKFDTNMVTLQYAHTRSIGGRYVALMAMLRGGKTEGRFGETGMRASSSGFADPFIGFSVNLFTLDAQMTHDFSNKTWGGLGMIYSNGGATTVRGVEQNGRQESLGLSATLGIRLGARYWLHLNYGETVAHNDAGLKGTLYRARIVAAF